MNKNALIVFVKNGNNVKTRIAKETDTATALAVYNALVHYCHNLCFGLIEIDTLVFYTPEINDQDNWNDIASKKHLQVEGDLGARMKAAIDLTLESYNKAVIIGSDCPYITKDHIYMAFEALNKADVVIGPALDGGYYLLGVNNTIPAIFEAIEWSTETVFDHTIDKLFSLRKSVQLLERLNDVDHYSDYLHWKSNSEVLNPD
jgi:uncharacterized protein